MTFNSSGQPYGNGLASVGECLYDGYPAVGRWMAEDPDGEPFVFRKFDDLAAQNLLALQSELLEMEERLKGLNHAAFLGPDMAIKAAAREWEVLIQQNAGEHSQPEVVNVARQRMALIKEIREKLKEYRKLGHSYLALS